MLSLNMIEKPVGLLLLITLFLWSPNGHRFLMIFLTSQFFFLFHHPRQTQAGKAFQAKRCPKLQKMLGHLFEHLLKGVKKG
jgi:hypothetical protein